MTDATAAAARPIPVVDIVPATIADLTVLATDRAAFAKRMGSPAPSGWPEFPAALGFTIDRLTTHPQEGEWWMHFFLVNGLLVGSGGYVGPPRKGEVEIGYEIAGEFRNRGYAAEAVRGFVNFALSDANVRAVVAHTLAEKNASNSVLARVGFKCVAELANDEVGRVWRWALAR